MKAKFWDGTLEVMPQCTKSLFIQLGEATTTVRRYIVDRIAYDIILGKSWLHEVSPENHWRSKSMKLCIKDSLVTLDAKCTRSESSIQEHTTTGKQSLRLTRKLKCKAIRELVRPSQDESTYQNEHPKEFGILLKIYSHEVPD